MRNLSFLCGASVLKIQTIIFLTHRWVSMRRILISESEQNARVQRLEKLIFVKIFSARLKHCPKFERKSWFSWKKKLLNRYPKINIQARDADLAPPFGAIIRSLSGRKAFSRVWRAGAGKGECNYFRAYVRKATVAKRGTSREIRGPKIARKIKREKMQRRRIV